MKHFIVDYKSIKFNKFIAHGGGDFAIRLVERIKEHKNFKISIINNDTHYWPEHTIDYSDFKKISATPANKMIYFDPFYKGILPRDIGIYYKVFLFIHGVRTLEMPYDTYAFMYEKGIKSISTLAKSIFLKTYYKKKENALLNSTNECEKCVILTPSDHSKFIMLAQPQLKTDIQVLPSLLNKDIEPSEYPTPTKRPYILFLNADRWVKNSYRFLKAIKELKLCKKLENLDVLIVGKPAFHKKFDTFATFIDYLDRPHLEYLMQNCFFLAYPSLNEGFGYPPLDCMKFGKPVLCTSISAPNMVFNGEVIFVNPFSIEELKARILYLKDTEPDINKQLKRKEFYSAMKIKVENSWIDFFNTL